MSSVESFYKPCSKCGDPVHARAAKCKNCGAASPWELNQKEANGSGDYVVVRPFRGMVGGVTVSLVTGQIVKDQTLIGHLLRIRAPILPKEEVGDMITCPHCHRAFLAENSAKPDVA